MTVYRRDMISAEAQTEARIIDKKAKRSVRLRRTKVLFFGIAEPTVNLLEAGSTKIYGWWHNYNQAVAYDKAKAVLLEHVKQCPDCPAVTDDDISIGYLRPSTGVCEHHDGVYREVTNLYDI